jgi:hypothetical protein
MFNNIKIKGELFANVYKNGKFLYQHHQSNLIVDTGLVVMANFLVGDFSNYEITQLGFGDGIGASQSSMLDMTGTNKRKLPIDSILTVPVISNIAKIYWAINFDADIAGQDMGGTNPWPAATDFTIKEIALFTANETMFNRILWDGPTLTLNTGIEFSGYFQITVTRGA